MNRGRPHASKAVLEPRNFSKFDGVRGSRGVGFRAGVFSRKSAVERHGYNSGSNFGIKREVNGLRGRRGFNFDRESYEEPHRGSSEKNPKRSEQGVHHRHKRGFTKFGKDCGESLGAKHNAKPTVSLGSFVDLGRTERGACKSGHGGFVCDGDKDYKTRHVGLCKSFFRDAEEDGFGKRDVEAVGSGVEGRRSSHSVRTGRRPCYFDHMGNGTGGASENGFVNSLENSSEMGGGMEIGESQFHFHFCEGNSCGLVGCPEGKKGRSIQTVQMGSYKGIIDNGDCSGVTDVGKVCVSDKGVNEESRCIMEERHSNEGLWKKDTVMKDYGRKTQ